MTAEQYLALEYHITVRLPALVADVKQQHLMGNTKEAWDALVVQSKYICQQEWHALSQGEQEEVLRIQRIDREQAERRTKLAKEGGRGAFGATWTGD